MNNQFRPFIIISFSACSSAHQHHKYTTWHNMQPTSKHGLLIAVILLTFAYSVLLL